MSIHKEQSLDALSGGKKAVVLELVSKDGDGRTETVPLLFAAIQPSLQR